MNFKEFLISINACEPARDWVGDKPIQEVWNTCERGDWMLWWFRRADNFDTRLFTLAKGHCANTVRHLMKDIRSTIAVDMAIKYGMGEATDQELSFAAHAACAAYAAYAARTKNQKETADICRKYLPMPIHSQVTI